MFEPLYDSYAGMCGAVGAKLVPVQLQAPDWSIPWGQLEAAFTPATKLVLVNTPHNPTGGCVCGCGGSWCVHTWQLSRRFRCPACRMQLVGILQLL
jgi:hypothetical protein